MKAFGRYGAFVLLLVFVLLIGCSDETNSCDTNEDGIISEVERLRCLGAQENGDSPLPDSHSDPGSNEPGSGDVEDVTLQAGILVLHMDPGSNGERPALYWDALVELVDLADSYDMKLSLHFTPQWADYIVEDDDKLLLVHSWDKAGHEIGLHHHGPTHPGNWDGYTNNEEYFDDLDFIGTMDEALASVARLSADGVILTASGTDMETDMPETILYETEGGGDETPILSVPEEVAYGDHTVWQVKHKIYIGGGQDAIQLPDLEEVFFTAESDEVTGVVFHAKNYYESPQKAEDLLKLFSDYGIPFLTAEEIVTEYLGE